LSITFTYLRQPLNRYTFKARAIWIISGTAFLWAIDPFIFILIMKLYIPYNIILSYLAIMVLMLPIIIAEGALTGYIAYKIYIRIKTGHLEKDNRS
jgi:hypothetical protein